MGLVPFLPSPPWWAVPETALALSSRCPQPLPRGCSESCSRPVPPLFLLESSPPAFAPSWSSSPVQWTAPSDGEAGFRTVCARKSWRQFPESGRFGRPESAPSSNARVLDLAMPSLPCHDLGRIWFLSSQPDLAMHFNRHAVHRIFLDLRPAAGFGLPVALAATLPLLPLVSPSLPWSAASLYLLSGLCLQLLGVMTTARALNRRARLFGVATPPGRLLDALGGLSEVFREPKDEQRTAISGASAGSSATVSIVARGGPIEGRVSELEGRVYALEEAKAELERRVKDWQQELSSKVEDVRDELVRAQQLQEDRSTEGLQEEWLGIAWVVCGGAILFLREVLFVVL